MSRILGTETEYGISSPDQPQLSPIITSTHAVVAFGQLEHQALSTRWDYISEHPLRDRRGFDLKRFHHIPVVDPRALGVANVMLPNGGRFYVDHAHPEYSSPETTNARDAMIYDQAGDIILQRAVDHIAHLTQAGHSILEHHDPCPPLRIYKNNVDGKGASYGSHENYLYRRDTDFDDIASSLIPYFVCRQVLTGAGRVGIGSLGEQPGFQISQRADYIEQEISLETTLNRGIINTRDEPHADSDRFGRLHIIVGDANMSQTATVLKLGMTSLILDAIENGVDFSDLRLADPVQQIRLVSRDLSLSQTLQMADGSSRTALDILRIYASRIQPDEYVYPLWMETMDILEDEGYKGCADRLDWCAKWSLISAYLSRGLDIDDPKIKLLDLQYCDISPERSLYHALVRSHRMLTLVSAEDIATCADIPPADTRAYLRGNLISHTCVDAANWDSVTSAGSKFAMLDPQGYTRDEISNLAGDSDLFNRFPFLKKGHV
ncbi:depupylase/deamidase Dop [Corynebacterium sp. ES2730-CONJ]|uniref:depupylase/deamidase Dop n=1 Tax=Corynebacterium sp. ES2730-CONJ TaxID=2973941 RepID=UPI00216B14E3|nr:depupylase/deamidase Dop [Corynebacterium sp. ES2730-CONJ]MCS4530965.1 depupylase/deamidase Dop [Corynebacterium sp. ES2730-CONJ]